MENRVKRQRIPDAEWYYALNNLNEVHGGPFGPGKKRAYLDLRKLRRSAPVDGPYRIVPENEVPEDANFYPE